MGEKRTLIITDLHGCYDECIQLLDKMAFDEENDTLINLGDTIDRGPKIYETFTFLRDLKERMGDRCILIRGNHEQMMLDASAGSRRDKELWYYNSGEKTVYSFINHKHKIQEFRSWYEAMPYYYTEERFQCVHACLKDEDPAKNDVETLIWGRDTDYEGKLVLTGHAPYRAPLYFKGDGAVAIIEEGIWMKRPETGMIALDTGCVYGNRLTGMVIEKDGFIVESVPSKAAAKR
ncbi:MAG: serine/threonine protein phosphatase [Oscillospiraceae bacterium]|nr:serine/threonine protein phosphatase [Oscillospiraceae bacterium]